MNSGSKESQLVATDSDRGARLDRWVAERLTNLSRARVQELIEQGLILLNGAPAKAAYRLRGGERVFVEAQERPALSTEPESIPLEILYEDDDVLVVNKPAGMPVHAGAGNARGTLVNALLGRGQALSRGGSATDHLRPGIVHRLDKETSGVMLIAKNDFAHARLAEAFRNRTVRKTYIALAAGEFPASSGKIDLPIGRDPVRRSRMRALTGASGRRQSVAGRARAALTEWRKLADLGPATLLEIQLHTGRTHQIRVHLSTVKHPLVGDTLYGGASHLRVAKTSMPELPRQFLHSAKLGFPHPRNGAWVEISTPLPPDLREYLRRLAASSGSNLAEVQDYLKA